MTEPQGLDPRLAARLAAHEPGDGEPPAVLRHAAVAMLLRGDPASLSVLLMTRAESPLDAWSGHVALPGGLFDPADESLLATARRETAEEVGLDLATGACLLCRLEREPAVGRGRRLPLEITPFVFAPRGPLPAPVPGDEATEAFWFPLAEAATGAFDDRFRYRDERLDVVLPCWRWEGRIVWGLTFRMLVRLLAVVRG